MGDLKQLKSSDVAKVREEITIEQDGVCELCKNKLTEKTGIHLDHQHRLMSSIIGEDGGGLIRGVLCRSCNVFEGKIWNNSKRFGLHDNLSDWLRNLADYLEKENYPLIHPSEAPRDRKLKKSSYNKLSKLYKAENLRAKFPEYPKSKKMTNKLAKLFINFELEPDYYGVDNG